MLIKEYSPTVRTRLEGSPFDGDDLFVEVRDDESSPWRVKCTFNTLSNDWAHTSAKESALQLSRRGL